MHNIPIPVIVVVIVVGVIWLIWKYNLHETNLLTEYNNENREGPQSEDNNGSDTNAKAITKKLSRFERIRNWTLENRWAILICFPLAHALIIALSFHYWLDHVAFNMSSWLAQLVMAISALLIPGGEKPLHHKVGRWILLASIPVLLYVILWKPLVWWIHPTSPEAVINQPIASSFSPAQPGCTEKDGDPETVKVMHEVLGNQPDMFAFAARESCFHQWAFTPDNKSLVGTPLRNPTSSATGALQILASAHEDWCKKKDPTADINTIAGNFKCGKLIYESDEPGRGPSAWNPQDGGILEFDIVAGKVFTQPIRIPHGVRGAWTFGNNAEYRENGVQLEKYPITGPGIRTEHGNMVRMEEFRVPADAAYNTAIGHFNYSYPPALSAKR